LFEKKKGIGHFGDRNIDGTMILTYILNLWDIVCELDSVGIG
jgi:hypothetical protein